METLNQDFKVRGFSSNSRMKVKDLLPGQLW